MPTYEYCCNQCNREFEKFQRITEPAHAECPTCGSSDTRRLISHSSFILKGSGWYVTDYARKNGGNGGASEKAAPGTQNEGSDRTRSTSRDASSASTRS